MYEDLINEKLFIQAKQLNLNSNQISKRDTKKRSQAFWYGFLNGTIVSEPAKIELKKIIEEIVK